ncbi:MAG: DUF58 domain-containing protein [Clostridiales bacterium]|nr:DUF58 domain-containing protein [Clostridiales bacterium]
MNGLVLLLAVLGLGLLQRMIIRKFGLRGLKYVRRFSESALFEGEYAEMIEVLRNDRPLFIPWLRAESRISPHIRLGKQENLSVKGEMYHKSVFTLRPFQQITRRHRVHFLRRGAYDVGNVTLSVGDLLALGVDHVELYTPAEMLVYPRLLPDTQLPLPVSRLQGDLTVRRHMLEDPFRVSGIRPYQRGDHPREVHWPATAKMGELQVKTHEYTADTRLMVVINCQMSENQWADLMEYEQAMIENAISIAATVCLNTLRAGVAAGLAANMPLGKQEGCALLPPEGGSARGEEILSACARLRIHREKNFLSFLEGLCFLRGTDILVLSAYTSPDVEERLQMLRAVGNTVTLHLMERGAEGV